MRTARSSSARGTATASVHIIVCGADLVVVVKRVEVRDDRVREREKDGEG